ncbi:MAG TPA: response regulator [Thermodesulfovibrionales bacterium]|nr:response regulator [Thermodesulfovibrionales bacterium]
MEKQRKILVIDNDPFERINCRVMLRGVEFIVMFCEDRESAIEKVSKEEFELIITNMMLPTKYIGLTLVQELHLMRPKADIVVMSDRPSIWDARESLRLGASGYIEKPFTPECLMNMAKKTFDKNGWIVRKACIDQFRDYIVPAPEDDNPLIYFKNGSWARHVQGCLWEVGYDMKYWSLSDHRKNGSSATHLGRDLRRMDGDMTSRLPYDQILSISVSEGLPALVAGEPYAWVLSNTGRVHAVSAPMQGLVRELNGEANDTMISCLPGDQGTDWMLWLARVQVPEWEYGTVKDVEEGRVVGTYEHIACPDINTRSDRAAGDLAHVR